MIDREREYEWEAAEASAVLHYDMGSFRCVTDYYVFRSDRRPIFSPDFGRGLQTSHLFEKFALLCDKRVPENFWLLFFRLALTAGAELRVTYITLNVWR